MKVYKMNDYDWVASPLSKEETNEWYKKEVGFSDDEQTVDEIEECDLKREGFYTSIEPEEAHELLDRFIKGEKVNDSRILKFTNCCDFSVWTTFENELKSYEELPNEPFIICSTEY